MTLKHLADQYASTLMSHVAGGGDSTLRQAHELGRRSLSEGFGVLEITVLYHQALARALERTRSAEESVQVIRAGESFFLESIAPLDTIYRGHRDLHQENHSWPRVV